MGVYASQSQVLPAEVEIELTGHCNASCTACPRDAMPKQGFIDAATIERIIGVVHEIRRLDFAAKAAPSHLPRVTVAGGGEPFLHRDAITHLRCIREATPELHVITNGSALTSRRAEELVALRPASITCSFWGVEREEYEKAMGLPFERTLARVEHLAALALSAGVPFEITWVRVPEIKSSDIQILTFWATRGISVAMGNTAAWNRAGLLNFAPGVTVGDLPDPTRRVWCTEIAYSVAFDWLGRCILCCCGFFDRRTVVLGSVHTDDWPTLRARKQALLATRPLPVPCRGCRLPRRAQAEWLVSPIAQLIGNEALEDAFYQ